MKQGITLEDLVRLAQGGDMEAKNKVVAKTMDISHSLVYMFNGGMFDEDLASLGYMGILKAIDSFNHNKNTKFTTHAYWQVKGEISHEFMRRETDKRKANYCTVSFATPIFGEGESEDKTLEDLLYEETNEFDYIYETGSKNIWWAYTQLNEVDKKLFYYKYIRSYGRKELCKIMNYNSMSNLGKREGILKQRLRNLMDR